MLLKAKERWCKTTVKIKPIFFEYWVGMQFKIMEGRGSGSYFCNSQKDFIFNRRGKIILALIKCWYWLYKYAWKHIKIYWPHRFKKFIKSKLSKKSNSSDNLPF